MGDPREHIVLGPPTTKDLELGGRGFSEIFHPIFLLYFQVKMLISYMYALALVDFFLLHFRFPYNNDWHPSKVWTCESRYHFPRGLLSVPIDRRAFPYL